jgi:hypothetical protein
MLISREKQLTQHLSPHDSPILEGYRGGREPTILQLATGHELSAIKIVIGRDLSSNSNTIVLKNH